MNPDGSPTPRSGAVRVTDLQLASADTDSRLQAAPSEWGVYYNNEKIIQPDSIVALDYHREWAVADFPLEKGAFASYDKVAKPFEIRLRMTKGGKDVDRLTFLAAIEGLGRSLTLYDVVTHDRTYLGVTNTSLGYARSATNGLGLLSVDVALRETRETAQSVMSSDVVKDPGSASPINGGQVQPAPASAAAAAAVAKYLGRAHVIPSAGKSAGH